MRSKIKVDKKYYKPVPWLVIAGDDRTSECEGCFFTNNGCINTTYGDICDDGGEFEGMILIEHTKEALADYVVKRLLGPSKEEE